MFLCVVSCSKSRKTNYNMAKEQNRTESGSEQVGLPWGLRGQSMWASLC